MEYRTKWSGISFASRGCVFSSSRGAPLWHLPLEQGASNVFVHFAPLAEDNNDIARKQAGDCSGGVVLPTVLSCREQPRVRRLFTEIVNTFRSRRGKKEEILSAKLSLLLCQLHEEYWEKESIPLEVRLAQNEIHQRQDVFLSINHLACIAGVSRRTLTTKFKAHTGSTLHEYQTHHKLQLALLQLTHEPHYLLRDIAEQYGFYDEFHFNRVFTQHYGVSPGSVRGKGLAHR